MNNNIHTYKSETLFVESILSSIHSRITKKNHDGSIFRLAVSGGSTPEVLYEKMSLWRDIDWSLVEIYLVDERYVAKSDKRSNVCLIEKTLLRGMETSEAKWIFFDTSLEIEEALKKYERMLQTEEDQFFDLVLLGLGVDAHTASLFPNSYALSIRDRWVAHTRTKTHDITDRLTLTYPALESSTEIFFLIKGKEKKAALARVYAAKPSDKKIPAAKLFHLAKTQVFFLKV